jgi:phosphate transport system permease protein
VLFLFTEGMGLFKNKLVEDGYQLVVNKQNDVSSLSAEQIKDIFDGEITNWNEIGGRKSGNYSFPFKRHNNYFTTRNWDPNWNLFPKKYRNS